MLFALIIITIKDKRLAGEKFGENVKNQFGKMKFGENVNILIIVTKFGIKFDDLVKFAKLFSRQTFVLYGIIIYIYQLGTGRYIYTKDRTYKPMAIKYNLIKLKF